MSLVSVTSGENRDHHKVTQLQGTQPGARYCGGGEP